MNKKEPNIQKTLNFVKKTLFFALFYSEGVQECLKKMLILLLIVGFQPRPAGYLSVMPPHLFIMQATNDSADDFVHHGQNQETIKTPRLNIFIRKTFLARNKN